MESSKFIASSYRRRAVAIGAAWLSVLFATGALADVTVGPTTITKYITYTDFGGGDVVFWVNGAMPTGCASGFWLPASGAGFKSEYAALMVAYTAGLPLVIYADPSTSWLGSSSGQFCRVTSLQPS